MLCIVLQLMNETKMHAARSKFGADETWHALATGKPVVVLNVYV